MQNIDNATRAIKDKNDDSDEDDLAGWHKFWLNPFLYKKIKI